MPVDESLSANPQNPAVQQGGPTQPGSPTVANVQTPGTAGIGLKFAQDLMALTQAKQNNAMQQIDRNMKAAEMGFPVDKDHLVKLANKAGIKVAKDPASLQAYIDSAHGQVPGPSNPQTGQAQPSQQKSANPTQQVNQGKMSVKQQKQQVGEIWAQRAIEAAQKRGESVQRMSELENQVTQLKLDLIGDDKEKSQRAAGKLMALNLVPFSLEKAEWTNASPEQKTAMINMAAGHESDAQLQQRVTAMQNSMIADGRFTDPEMAHKAATALANNQPIPTDVRATMKPFTARELTDQATMAGELVSLGVPPSKLQGVIAAAEVGGLEHALPTGINPLIVQQIAQKNQELRLEQERVGIEGEQAQTQRGMLDVEKGRVAAEVKAQQNTGERIQIMANAEENKEFFTQFQAIVAMDKAQKGSVPPEVMNSYVRELAEKSGLEVTTVKSWYNYIVGGSHDVFTPRPNMDAASAGAGKPGPAQQTTPSDQGSALSHLYKKAKKALSPEQTN